MEHTQHTANDPPALRIIDLHTHTYAPAWRPAALPTVGHFASVWPLLSDIAAQLEALHAAGIDGKVLSAPVSSLAAPGQTLPLAQIQTINEHFADLVVLHPGRLLALATIDPWQGDAAAREVERVRRDLGIGGIIIDAALGDAYLTDPATRPTFEVAAALGVAAFIHPVSPAALTTRLARGGPIGVLLGRGTDTAASVLGLLRSGLLRDLPRLNLILPAIAASALIFAGQADLYDDADGAHWGGGLPSATRTRLHLDTMGLDPALIRFAIDLLGSEQVLFGTDWPIMRIADRSEVLNRLARAGVSDAAAQRAILSGNTLRLLGQRPGSEDTTSGRTTP